MLFINNIFLSNKMESRIIYNIEKFVAFLFGKENDNDPEQRIYNKLLRLEGEELDIWMNKKVKKYITGKDYFFEFQGDNFEGVDGPTLFKNWYWNNIFEGTGKALSHHEIYGEHLYISIYLNEEFKIIKNKIQIFKEKFIHYERERKWGIMIFMDYLEMYIMSMNAEDLKEFIIRQVDPVEIR